MQQIPLGLIRMPVADMQAAVPLVPGLPRRQLPSATSNKTLSGLQLVTETFSEGGYPIWVAPPTTFQIEMLVGMGGVGDPGDPGTPDIPPSYTYDTSTTHYFFLKSGGTDSYTDYTWGNPGRAPYTAYCDPYIPDDFSTNYDGYQTCYGAEEHYDPGSPGDPGYPPTQGAPSQAFGFSFPGGYGSNPLPLTYVNIPVQPGESYIFTLNNTITITYYK